MKKTIIAATLILLLIPVFVLAATKTGKFQIGNEPPTASNLRVQDGDPSWDSIAPLDTHDITPNFQWDISDPNPDTLKTKVCISSSLARDCDLVNDFSLTIVDTYTVAGGVLSWPVCGTSKTYYIDLTPNDGTVYGTKISTEFVILNSVPTTSNLIMNPEILPATSPRSTHSQTPIFSWTAADADDGSVDRWPNDNPSLTNSILVGDSCAGPTYPYLNKPTLANPSGETTSTIPWGAIVGSQSIKNFCTRITAIDNAGCSASLDTTLNLIDNIPNPDPSVTGVKLSEDLLDMRTCYAPYNPPTQPNPACWINPSEGQYQTLNLRAEFTELDNDCSADNVQVVLKYPSQGVNYPAKDFVYALTYASGTSACVFTGTFSSTQGIEFFRQTPATDYNMEVTITSQAGSLSPGIFGWDIVELPYIKIADTYTDTEDGVIDLGDPAVCTSGESTTGNGISLNQWNPGLCLEKITNWGNLLLTLKWTATDPKNVNPLYTCPEIAPNCCLGSSTSGCWDLTTASNRFWLDDDNDVTLEAAPLTPANIPEEGATPITFNPASGLQVCNVMTCADAALDETLNTYYHINPPTGLSPGDYETIMTIGLI